MAFKLSKAQAAQVTEMAGKLREKAEEIEAAVTVVNEQHEAAIENELKGVIDEYNALVEEAQELVEGLANDFRAQFDDKSENWQGSDKGSDAEEFIQQFEAVSFTEVDVPEPEELTVDVGDDADTLEGLPADIG